MAYAKLVFSSEECSGGYSFTVESDFIEKGPGTWTDTERRMASLAGEAIHMIRSLLGGGVREMHNLIEECREKGLTAEEAKAVIAKKVRELEATGEIRAKSPQSRELMNETLGGHLGSDPAVVSSDA